MGSEWLAFGACAAVDELGNHIRTVSSKRAYEQKMAVAKIMQCSPEFDEKINSEVADPSKYDSVWSQIERFKRKNPHLCVAKCWEDVGKRRLPLHSSRVREEPAILDFRIATARLLCRTYGKLMPEHAVWLAMKGTYMETWKTFGETEDIHPVVDLSRSAFRSLRNSFKESIGPKTDKLRDEIGNARGEGHDAIVYMTSMEFDPDSDTSVEYMTQKVLSIAIPDYKPPVNMPASVCRAVTRWEYDRSVAKGGETNEFICQSIADREEREDAARQKRFMNYVPDNQRFGALVNDIMWSYHFANLPDDVAPSVLSRMCASLKQGCIDTYFDGSFIGIFAFFLSIIGVWSAIAAIVSLFS